MRFFDRLHAFGHAHRAHPGEHPIHHFGRHHHRGFHGFEHGEGFPGDPRRGGLGASRKLGSADLQLLTLALLAEKPRHGYEVIKALDERSKGYYSPSPGMVYPALTYLEEIGHATVETEGTKKRYSITDTGTAHLEENREAVDTLLQQLEWIGRRMDHVREAMAGLDGADESLGDEPPHGHGGRGRHGRRDGAIAELQQARQALTAALAEKAGTSASEQQRVAAILERAAAEIRAGQAE